MSTDTAEILAAIAALNTRLDRLEHQLDAVTAFTSRLPVMADAAGHLAEQAVAAAAAEGVDAGELISRAMDLGPRAIRVADRALSAEQLALVETLLDQKDLLLFGLEAGRGLMAELDAAGVDAKATAAKGAKVAARLATVVHTPEFDRLVDSGALGKDVVGVVGDASAALVASRGKIEAVGPFAVLGRLFDADVQAAVGFTFGIAKRFGAALRR